MVVVPVPVLGPGEEVGRDPRPPFPLLPLSTSLLPYSPPFVGGRRAKSVRATAGVPRGRVGGRGAMSPDVYCTENPDW